MIIVPKQSIINAVILLTSRAEATFIYVMTVHLLKPALRINDVYEFSHRQKERVKEHKGQKVYPVWTSRKPSREKELLNEGSLFWIVKNQIQCRQSILDIVPYQENDDEKPSYLFLCSPQLVRVQPISRKPFQGWRYLESENAPPDIGIITNHADRPPPELEKPLKEAGLL